MYAIVDIYAQDQQQLKYRNVSKKTLATHPAYQNTNFTHAEQIDNFDYTNQIGENCSITWQRSKSVTTMTAANEQNGITNNYYNSNKFEYIADSFYHHLQ